MLLKIYIFVPTAFLWLSDHCILSQKYWFLGRSMKYFIEVMFIVIFSIESRIFAINLIPRYYLAKNISNFLSYWIVYSIQFLSWPWIINFFYWTWFLNDENVFQWYSAEALSLVLTVFYFLILRKTKFRSSFQPLSWRIKIFFHWIVL